jgi:hypothetical protein
MRTEQQLKQRKRQTASAKVKQDANIASGLCRCGKPREVLRWLMCESCREKARGVYYGVRAAPHKKRKLSARTPADRVGVKRRNEADGYGNVNLWWVATCLIKKKMHTRRWSVNKHGDHQAFALALAQREEWVKLRDSLK